MSKSKKTSSPSKMLSLRLGGDEIDRADALILVIGALPEYKGVMRVNRSAVLRMALVRGLNALEAEMSS